MKESSLLVCPPDQTLSVSGWYLSHGQKAELLSHVCAYKDQGCGSSRGFFTEELGLALEADPSLFLTSCFLSLEVLSPWTEGWVGSAIAKGH